MGLAYPRKKGWSAREERHPGRKKAEKKATEPKAKQPRGRPAKKKGNAIIYNDSRKATELLLRLELRKRQGDPVNLYDNVNAVNSTTRALCLHFGTAPTVQNANRLHALIEHFRKHDAKFRETINSICPPSNLSLQRTEISDQRAAEKKRLLEEAKKNEDEQRQAAAAQVVSVQQNSAHEEFIAALSIDDDQEYAQDPATPPENDPATSSENTPPKQSIESSQVMGKYYESLSVTKLVSEYKKLLGILNTHGSRTIDAGKNIADSLNAINEILSHRIRSAATHSKFAAEIESSLKKCMQMAQPRVLKKKTAAPASDDANYPMVKRMTTRMKIPTSKP